MRRIEATDKHEVTLLAPLDGSNLAESALPAVVALARRLPARATLLHAIERNAPESVHGERHLRDAAEAERYLAEVADRLAAQGITADWHVHVVPVGDIARSIAAHANEQPAALIVLSTHDATDPRSWLIGAVAQEVIRFAMAPVLALRTGRKGEPPPFDPAGIIVAIDSEQQGIAALPAAIMLARALQIPLRLLAVVPTVETITGDQAVSARLMPSGARVAFDATAEEMADLLQRVQRRLREIAPDLEVAADVARGDPAQVMAARTRDQRAILALATHGRAGLDALWEGSTGGLAIARSAGPFLLVHPEPADSTLAP